MSKNKTQKLETVKGLLVSLLAFIVTVGVIGGVVLMYLKRTSEVEKAWLRTVYGAEVKVRLKVINKYTSKSRCGTKTFIRVENGTHRFESIEVSDLDYARITTGSEVILGVFGSKNMYVKQGLNAVEVTTKLN